jgi:3-hydroxybutyryl-CoA dehydrogenase
VQLKDIKNIAVVGAGTMGYGIGLTFALEGYQVTLQDRGEEILQGAISRVKNDLETFVECGVASRDMIQTTLVNIATTTSLKEATKNADFVTEAVTEDVEIKRAVFSELETYCPERTILASNTSSLVLRDFTSQCKRRDRILIAHWVNPPHIAPVVEVVHCEGTSIETIEMVCSLLKRVGKKPVRIMKEIPGLIHNRILAGMIREVWALWEKGIASAEDIDLVVQGGFGLRLAAKGPLANCDLGGLDIWYATEKQLFKEISDAHEPPERLGNMVKSGELGIKSGRGFFNYQNSSSIREQVKERDRILISLLKASGDKYLGYGRRLGHD